MTSGAAFRTGDDQEWLSASYEVSLARAAGTARGRRTQLGAFYTPSDLAAVLVRLSLAPWLREGQSQSRKAMVGRNSAASAGAAGRGTATKCAAAAPPCPRILDPACGSGNLLVAAAHALAKAGFSAAAIAKSLHGVDIDPIAISIARTRVARLLRLAPAAARRLSKQIRVGDALFDRSLAGAFDIVIGNPPFLSQLGGATVIDRARAARLLDRFGGAVRGYADMAAAFLLLGAESLRPGGRMAMIEPVSILSAAHAAAVRERVGALAQLECIHFERQKWASAATHVAVLAFRAATPRRAASLRILPSPGTTLPWSAWQGRWSAAMAAHAGVPRVRMRCDCTIGDVARVAADFRDQYYGLRGAVLDKRTPRGLRIVTTGLIDWAGCRWGERPVRLLGKIWRHPEVNERTAARNPDLKEWLADARRPKVIVAVQTKVIEAFADADGRFGPGVPLIRVMPRRRGDLWLVLAALLSPVTSAHAWWLHAGAGLSPKALKLSAKQIAALPLPANTHAWARAARSLRALQRSRGARAAERVSAFAHHAMAAHGVPRRERPALLAWWLPLIEGRRTRP